MKKTHLAAAIIAIIALGVLAVPKTMAEKQVKKDRSVKIEGATPENPVVYLGKSFDKKSGKFVDGYAIVHYAKNASKPAKPTKPSADTACYGFLAKGAKWKEELEPWTFDETLNSEKLDAMLLKDNMEYDITKWEKEAGVQILGEGSVGSVSPTLGETKTLDDKNEVKFANIDSSGAIAVTYIWGIFGGSLNNRQLMEWDMIYDDADFDWSLSEISVSGKMDFENIATHELGHSVGMNDLYTSGCSDQTMFGYAGYGEIKKRDLAPGDIAGIKYLYQ